LTQKEIYLNEKKLLQEHEKRFRDVIDYVNDITSRKKRTKLNVGGVKYETTIETLIRHSWFFRTLLFDILDLNSIKDEDGFIFVDRDGYLFKNILSYMRTSNIHVLQQNNNNNNKINPLLF